MKRFTGKDQGHGKETLMRHKARLKIFMMSRRQHMEFIGCEQTLKPGMVMMLEKLIQRGPMAVRDSVKQIKTITMMHLEPVGDKVS